MRGYSSAIGSLTLKIISARFQTSSAVGTISAPAALYVSSAMPLPRPAPCCTRTLWPRAVSVRAPAGIMPTRYSRVFTSVGTPTIIGFLRRWGRLNVTSAARKSITRRVSSAAGGHRLDVDAVDLDDALAFAEMDAEMRDRHPLTFGREAELVGVEVATDAGVGLPLVDGLLARR